MLQGPTPITQRTRVGGEDALPVDLLHVADETREAFRTRERFEWLGTTLSVVSREELLSLKRLSARPQDLVDIERLDGGDG